MRKLFLGITLLSFGFAFAFAQTDKPRSKDTIPAILLWSRFVYVEAHDGDRLDPRVNSADRQAIVNLEHAIQDWKRYVITLKRSDAELIFAVRKGTDVGPPDDLLEVCILNSETGLRSGPIWTRSMQDGLDPPDMLLFQQLKQAVDSAAKSKSPQKP